MIKLSALTSTGALPNPENCCDRKRLDPLIAMDVFTDDVPSQHLQGSAKIGASGLVNFVSDVACHLCPARLKHLRNLVHRL